MRHYLAKPRMGRMAGAAMLLGGAAGLAVAGPAGHPPVPGAVLTSATGFGLSGTVGNLAPGAAATLVVTATNPYSVPITLTSLTVSVPAVPANCPPAQLTLGNAAFSGTPPAVTLTGLSQAVPANGSADLSLPILLARGAANGCQKVTFPFSYSGTAAYTAATTTTLASSANPALFGNPVTLTATATASAPANPPAGQVTFYLCTNAACTTSAALGPAAALSGTGQASLSVPGLPGGSYQVFARFTPSDATSYAPSTSASLTQVVGFSSPCITTTVPGLVVSSGQSVCVSAPGKVSGSVTVNSGGALALDGAAVGGSVTATGATALRFCGATIGGSVSVSASAGFLLIGDGGDDGSPACAGNTVKGGLTLGGGSGGFEAGGNTVSGSAAFTGNTGTAPYWQDAGPEIEGNKISGSLSCSGNSPAPVNGGQANKVSDTRSGQCSAAGF